MTGFNGWRGLTENTIETFSTNFPDADIAILTRLCDLAVIDIDSDRPCLVAMALVEFGFTPLLVKTKRGWHLYYSNPERITGHIGEKFRVDIKGAGQSDYVVVPPSNDYEFHIRSLEKEIKMTDDIYDYLEVIHKGLPSLNIDGLKTFFPNHPYVQRNGIFVPVNDNINFGINPMPIRIINQRTKSLSFNDFDDLHSDIFEGTRNNTMWEWGMRCSAVLVKVSGEETQTYEELLRRMHLKNERSCDPNLPDRHIDKLAEQIWNKYQLLGKNNFYRTHYNFMTNITLTPRGVLENLENLKGVGLLMWLKSHHGDESEFPLNRTGLAKALDWKDHSVRIAISYLKDNELVTQESPADRLRGIAAIYKFTEKTNLYVSRIPALSPSNDNTSVPCIAPTTETAVTSLQEILLDRYIYWLKNNLRTA